MNPEDIVFLCQETKSNMLVINVHIKRVNVVVNPKFVMHLLNAINVIKHIVIIMYAYGGFVPSTFQKVEEYTPDKFTKWIVKEGKKALFLQCLENIDKIPLVD